MRVLRVLTRPNLGGPSRQVAALYAEHRRLGLRTLLAVGRCEAGETPLSMAALGLPELPLATALSRGPEAEGVVEIPDLRRGLDPFADRRALATLAALLASFRPDVVHTHTSKAGLLGRRAAVAAGVPVVAHTFHGHVLRDYYGPVRSWLLARIERRLAARSTLLFAVSNSCADELAALGVAPRARLQVVPPAVAVVAAAPAARAAARSALQVPADVALVACAGRLVPVKRVDLFLAALAAMPAVRGEVFGDGPLRARLQAAAPPNVQFRGARPDLATLLPACDALLLPSRREGCPLVAVEAFAAGVPVVGLDVPGVRDAIVDWGAGVLVPQGDGAAATAANLAAAVTALLADADRRAALLAAGQAALPRFAPAAVAATLLAAYQTAR